MTVNKDINKHLKNKLFRDHKLPIDKEESNQPTKRGDSNTQTSKDGNSMTREKEMSNQITEKEEKIEAIETTRIEVADEEQSIVLIQESLYMIKQMNNYQLSAILSCII